MADEDYRLLVRGDQHAYLVGAPAAPAGHADLLATRGGHYLFPVKDNQPLLRQQLMRLPWAQALPAAVAAEPDMAGPSPAR